MIPVYCSTVQYIEIQVAFVFYLQLNRTAVNAGGIVLYSSLCTVSLGLEKRRYSSFGQKVYKNYL